MSFTLPSLSVNRPSAVDAADDGQHRSVPSRRRQRPRMHPPPLATSAADAGSRHSDKSRPPTPPPGNDGALIPHPPPPHSRPPPSHRESAAGHRVCGAATQPLRTRLAALQQSDAALSFAEAIARVEVREAARRRLVAAECGEELRRFILPTAHRGCVMAQYAGLLRVERRERARVLEAEARSWLVDISLAARVAVLREVEEPGDRHRLVHWANDEAAAILRAWHRAIETTAVRRLQRVGRLAMRMRAPRDAAQQLLSTAVAPHESHARAHLECLALNLCVSYLQPLRARLLLEARCMEGRRRLVEEGEAQARVSLFAHEARARVECDSRETRRRTEHEAARAFTLLELAHSLFTAIIVPERAERHVLASMQHFLRSERRMGCVVRLQRFVRRILEHELGHRATLRRIGAAAQRYRATLRRRHYHHGVALAALHSAEAAFARDFGASGGLFAHRRICLERAAAMAADATAAQEAHARASLDAEHRGDRGIAYDALVVRLFESEHEARFAIRIEFEVRLKCRRVELSESRARAAVAAFQEPCQRLRLAKQLRRVVGIQRDPRAAAVTTISARCRGLLARRRVAELVTERTRQELELHGRDPVAFAALQERKRIARNARRRSTMDAERQRGAARLREDVIVESDDEYDQYCVEEHAFFLEDHRQRGEVKRRAAAVFATTQRGEGGGGPFIISVTADGERDIQQLRQHHHAASLSRTASNLSSAGSSPESSPTPFSATLTATDGGGEHDELNQEMDRRASRRRCHRRQRLLVSPHSTVTLLQAAFTPHVQPLSSSAAPSAAHLSAAEASGAASVAVSPWARPLLAPFSATLSGFEAEAQLEAILERNAFEFEERQRRLEQRAVQKLQDGMEIEGGDGRGRGEADAAVATAGSMPDLSLDADNAPHARGAASDAVAAAGAEDKAEGEERDGADPEPHGSGAGAENASRPREGSADTALGRRSHALELDDEGNFIVTERNAAHFVAQVGGIEAVFRELLLDVEEEEEILRQLLAAGLDAHLRSAAAFHDLMFFDAQRNSAVAAYVRRRDRGLEGTMPRDRRDDDALGQLTAHLEQQRRRFVLDAELVTEQERASRRCVLLDEELDREELLRDEICGSREFAAVNLFNRVAKLVARWERTRELQVAEFEREARAHNIETPFKVGRDVLAAAERNLARFLSSSTGPITNADSASNDEDETFEEFSARQRALRIREEHAAAFKNFASLSSTASIIQRAWRRRGKTSVAAVVVSFRQLRKRQTDLRRRSSVASASLGGALSGVFEQRRAASSAVIAADVMERRRSIARIASRASLADQPQQPHRSSCSHAAPHPQRNSASPVAAEFGVDAQATQKGEPWAASGGRRIRRRSTLTTSGADAPEFGTVVTVLDEGEDDDDDSSSQAQASAVAAPAGTTSARGGYDDELHTAVLAARFSLEFDFTQRLQLAQRDGSNCGSGEASDGFSCASRWLQAIEAMEREDLTLIWATELEFAIWRPIFEQKIIGARFADARWSLESAEAARRRQLQEWFSREAHGEASLFALCADALARLAAWSRAALVGAAGGGCPQELMSPPVVRCLAAAAAEERARAEAEDAAIDAAIALPQRSWICERGDNRLELVPNPPPKWQRQRQQKGQALEAASDLCASFLIHVTTPLRVDVLRGFMSIAHRTVEGTESGVRSQLEKLQRAERGAHEEAFAQMQALLGSWELRILANGQRPAAALRPWCIANRCGGSRRATRTALPQRPLPLQRCCETHEPTAREAVMHAERVERCGLATAAVRGREVAAMRMMLLVEGCARRDIVLEEERARASSFTDDAPTACPLAQLQRLHVQAREEAARAAVEQKRWCFLAECYCSLHELYGRDVLVPDCFLSLHQNHNFVAPCFALVATELTSSIRRPAAAKLEALVSLEAAARAQCADSEWQVRQLAVTRPFVRCVAEMERAQRSELGRWEHQEYLAAMLDFASQALLVQS